MHPHLSDEDLEGEDLDFASLDDDSSSPENQYMSNSMANMGGVTSVPGMHPNMSNMVHQSQMVTPQMVTPQMLQQHM